MTDEAGDGWPVVVYRSRLRDTIQATVLSLPPTGLCLLGLLFAARGELSTAGLSVLLAVPWAAVATLLWLNRRQRVTLAAHELIIQRRLVEQVVPYDQVADLTADTMRGIVVRTDRGARLMLPWPPLKTPSGYGHDRRDEVHAELARRVDAVRPSSDGPRAPKR